MGLGGHLQDAGMPHIEALCNLFDLVVCGGQKRQWQLLKPEKKHPGKKQLSQFFSCAKWMVKVTYFYFTSVLVGVVKDNKRYFWF